MSDKEQRFKGGNQPTNGLLTVKAVSAHEPRIGKKYFNIEK